MLRAWIENCDASEECQAEAVLASFRFWKDYLPSTFVNCCLNDDRHREGPQLGKGRKKMKEKKQAGVWIKVECVVPT
jgi:hypothetical protein